MDEMNKNSEEQNLEEVKEQEFPADESSTLNNSAPQVPAPKSPKPKLPLIVVGIVAAVAVIAVVLVLILGGKKHEHSFADWNIVDDPTCHASGIEERICECGKKEIRTVAAKEHTYNEWVIENNKLARSCCACGYKEIKEVEETVDSLKPSKDGIKIETTEGNSLPKGTIVVTNIVTESFDQEDIEVIEESIQTSITSGEIEILAIYDISFDYLGSSLQPNGMVKVVLPKPDEKYSAYVVVYIDEHGFATPMTTEIVGNEIVFETTHFSKYGIIGYTPDSHEHLFNEWIVVEEPTCTKKGSEERFCTCGETETRKIDEVDHTDEIIPSVESTCTKNGLTEGVKCSVCKEILIAQQEVPIAPHIYDNQYDEYCNVCGHRRDAECAHEETEVISGYEATCTSTGLTDGEKCNKCGTILVSQSTIPLKSHTEVTDKSIGATCTSTGLTEGSHCSVCGVTLVAQQEVPIVPHTYDNKYDEDCNFCGHRRDAECAHEETEIISGYEATCVSTGLTDGEKCKKCGEILVEQVTISAKDHTSLETVSIENKVEPTCMTSGSYDEVVYCTECGKELSRTRKSIEMLEHLKGVVIRTEMVEASCRKEGLMSETTYCQICGNMISQILCVINKIPHIEYVEIENSISATCKSSGKYDNVTYCEICGELSRETVIIEKRSHTPGELVVENYADSTCTDLGGYDEVEYCTGCGDECSRNHISFSTLAEHHFFNGFCEFCGVQSINEDLEYILSNDGTYYSVIGIGNFSGIHLIIPPIYNELPVKHIAESAFEEEYHLVSVTISENIESIGNRAFFGCLSLEKIYFNAICMNDLADDNKIFVDSVKENYDNDGGNAPGIEVIIGKNVSKIPANLFCASFDEATYYENRVFFTTRYYNSRIEKLTFEKGGVCETIGEKAFFYCQRLVNVEIISSITKIGNRAFGECSSVENVFINNIDSWCQITFGDYDSIFDNDANPMYRGADLYINYNLATDVIVSEGVKSINSCAFNGCTSLVKITLPDSLEKIGSAAFLGCTSLVEITIPDNVKEIKSNTFKDCLSLRKLLLHNQITWFSFSAIENCLNLEFNHYGNGRYLGDSNAPYTIFVGATTKDVSSVTIHEETKFICQSSLEGCHNLAELHFDAISICSNKVHGYIENTWFLNDAGSNTDGIKLYIGKNVVEIPLESDFFRRAKIKSLIFEEGSVCEIMGSPLLECEYLEEIVLNAPYMNKDLNFALIFSGGLIKPTGGKTKGISIYVGKGVVEIPAGMFSNSFITSITFEEGSNCKKIGKHAFYRTSINEIVIPNSVNEIGEGAFAGCMLEYLSLPFIGSDVHGTISTKLGYIFHGHLFSVPESLKTVVVTSGLSIPDSAFDGCASITTIALPNEIKSIGNGAFSGCTSLMEINIPESVENIGSAAFQNCISLENIEIPSAVDKISGGMFYGCSSLLEIQIPKNVTIIGASAFYGCSSLVSISIPDGVTEIGSWAFNNCTSLEDVTIADSVTSIAMYAFKGCDSIINIETPFFDGFRSGVPESLKNIVITGKTRIGNATFADCKSVKTIVISNNVTEIVMGAFSNCTSLELISIPFIGSNKENGGSFRDIFINDIPKTLETVIITGNEDIPSHSFKGCPYIKKVIISGDSSVIYESAFEACVSLESVSIGDVSVIYESAFEGCVSLEYISIPSTIEQIGRNAFSNTKIKFSSYGNCNYLGNEENPYLVLVDVQSKEYNSYEVNQKTKLIADYAFENCSAFSEISIPNSVLAIGSFAFENCTALSTINLGDNTHTIGVSAFAGCTALKDIDLKNVSAMKGSTFEGCISLKSVVIPDGVTLIPAWTFSRCESLEYIYIPESVTYVLYHAFYKCTSLKEIDLKNISVIESFAFYGCKSLESMKIGNQLTTIERQAIENCQSLKDVYYTGTEEEWQKIFIDWYNDSLLEATIHYNYISEE